jgi:hypothetical protein
VHKGNEVFLADFDVTSIPKLLFEVAYEVTRHADAFFRLLSTDKASGVLRGVEVVKVMRTMAFVTNTMWPMFKSKLVKCLLLLLDPTRLAY